MSDSAQTLRRSTRASVTKPQQSHAVPLVTPAQQGVGRSVDKGETGSDGDQTSIDVEQRQTRGDDCSQSANSISSATAERTTELTDDSRNDETENTLVSANETADDREFARLATIDLTSIDVDEGQRNKDRAAFAAAQANDPALAHVWNIARRGSERYVIKDGLLFEHKPPWVQSDFDDLLLIPHDYKHRVLETAHDNILGGCHFGRRKTQQKIYAAGLAFVKTNAEVKAWVSSCTACQRTAARRTAEHHGFPW